MIIDLICANRFGFSVSLHNQKIHSTNATPSGEDFNHELQVYCSIENMSATIEEISDHSEHDHAGHDHHHDDDPTSTAALEKIQSRAERKARKALLGLGLKKVPQITRVTLRRPKNVS